MRKKKKVFFLLCAMFAMMLVFSFSSIPDKTVFIPEPFSTLMETSETDQPLITVTVYDTKKQCVIALPLEDYLCGVVLAEMPASFDKEALKAQAVAARSFCMYRFNKPYFQEEESHHGASVCTDYHHCKAYLSYEDAVDAWSQEWTDRIYPTIKEAVSATAGIILAYQQEPVNAVFHAMSAGKTESSLAVWGTDIPYLQAVDSPETEETIADLKTTVTFTDEQVKALLKENGYRNTLPNDSIEWISNIIDTATGRVSSVTIGTVPMTGNRMREIFGLRSTNFTVGHKDHSFLFTVYGYGHGVGMSQYGADLLAKEGWTYDKILNHYYPHTELVPLSSLNLDFCPTETMETQVNAD